MKPDKTEISTGTMALDFNEVVEPEKGEKIPSLPTKMIHLVRERDLKRYWNHVLFTITHPEKARKFGIAGMVIVQFIVDNRGNAGNVSVIRSTDTDLYNEGVRMIGSSPKWEPGVPGVKISRSFLPYSSGLSHDNQLTHIKPYRHENNK